jgi:hypothetical protein
VPCRANCTTTTLPSRGSRELKSLLRENPSEEVIDATSPIADEECAVLLERIARSPHAQWPRLTCAKRFRIPAARRCGKLGPWNNKVRSPIAAAAARLIANPCRSWRRIFGSGPGSGCLDGGTQVVSNISVRIDLCARRPISLDLKCGSSVLLPSIGFGNLYTALSTGLVDVRLRPQLRRRG